MSGFSIKPPPGTYPFRLGCTSYVIPDDLLPNVRHMAARVDDIEIVLFESEDISNLPDTAVIQELCQLSLEHNLSYTIHLPTDLKALGGAAADRQRFIDQARRIIDLFEAANPIAYIVHLEGHEDFDSPIGRSVFHSKSLSLMQGLFSTSISPTRFAIENLHYPWQLNLPIALESGCALCTDIGHIVMTGCRLDEALHAMMPHTRVIHLHGINQGKDHQSLAWMRPNPDFMATAYRHIQNYSGVLTLEVFEEQDTCSSIQTIRELFT